MTNDGPNNGDQTSLVSAVRGKESLCDWQNTEDNFRKGLCKSDRIIEVVDRKIILGGLDCGNICVGEDTVGGKGMELFLLDYKSAYVRSGDSEASYVDDGGESFNNVLLVASLVAFNTGCDVAEEFAKVRRLKQLVRCDELECLGGPGGQLGGKRSVRNSATSEYVDLL